MTALCTVSYCPAPTDPDWHRCFVCQNNSIEHHHVKPRGMGGSKKKSPVVALCHSHHEMVTLHECSDDILDLPGGKTYVYFDLHGKTLAERALSQEEESDEPTVQSVRLPGGDSIRDTHQLRSLGVNPVALTHDQRVAIAAEIRDAQLQRQWRAGDVANAWDEELGEEFWNLYANEFGYTYPSLRNVMRVCKKIPPERRHPGASFALHDVVDGFDFETQEAWLERAVDEEWTVKRLREEMVAEGLLQAKPKIKKWALEELLAGVEAWPYPPDRPRPKGAVRAYLTWLGGQG